MKYCEITEQIIKTNADKIRNMTDEELAELLTKQRSGYDYIKTLDWLQSESKD